MRTPLVASIDSLRVELRIGDKQGNLSAVELRFCKHTTFIAEYGCTYIVEQCNE